MPVERSGYSHFVGLLLVCLLVVLALAETVGGAAQAADKANTPVPEAGPPTHIYATDWGLTLSADGSGFYNDLARFLFLAPEVGPVDYEILPYRRANRSFLDDAASCKYPSSIAYNLRGGLIPSAEGYLNSLPVVLTRVHLFSRPGREPAHRAEDVDGKTIAYAMGARTPALLAGHSALFIAVADEVDKARMLLSGRVDMITAAVPDVEFVFRELKVDMAPFAPELTLDVSPMGVDCHAGTANAAFLARLDARIRKLHASGELIAFYRSQGLDPASYVPPAP
ncbi:MAG: hypothetical protein EP335_17695 [Alphaproteobacteria bacterium]|nr:MAG: hypothetical protein EP335_17695 [Alphaproteobacteria bacterium]